MQMAEDETESLAETMRDLIEASEIWTEELAKKSMMVEGFIIVIILVCLVAHFRMYSQGLEPFELVIIIVSWIIFTITITKYHGFTVKSREERDLWKARLRKLREHEEELSTLLE